MYYRFQTRDGLVVSHARIISETEEVYWVAPSAVDGDAYMIAIQKNQLQMPPQKTSDPGKVPLLASALDTKQKAGFWDGKRISVQESYMRDAGWYKIGPYSNNQRGISALSTHLANEHSRVNRLKPFSMLIPGLRIEGTLNTNGFALSGGQIQTGLAWIFPIGNHRLTIMPQIGISILNKEIVSNDVSTSFIASGIVGYEYLIGSVSLMLNLRLSYLDVPTIDPITLIGGGVGLAYHIPD